MKNEPTIYDAFDMAIHHLVETAKKNKLANNQTLTSSIGEMQIKGIDYQIQISFNPDKIIWVDSDNVSISENTKITF